MRRPDRRSATLWACLVFATFARAASADEIPIPIRYEVSDSTVGCPDEEAFRDLLFARLGRDPFRAAEENERGPVYVRIWSNGAGVTGEVRAGKTERRLDTGDCGELAAALATTTAIMIEAWNVEGSVETDQRSRSSPRGATSLIYHEQNDIPSENVEARAIGPTNEPDLERPPALMEQRERRTARPASDGVTWMAGVGLGAGLGLLPDGAIEGTVRGGFRSDGWSLWLEGRYDATPGAVTVGGQRVRAHVLTAGLAPCADGRHVFGCLTVAVGTLQAHGLELDDRGDGAWVGWAGGRVGLRWSLADEVSLRAQLELIAPWTRITFEAGENALWDAPPVAGSLEVGAEVAIF